MKPIKVVLSGTYHRDPQGLERLYAELQATGCQVLSPFSLHFDNRAEPFVRTVHETQLSERELEMHHLTAILHADFLWVHLPEGYAGTSTAFEIGYAAANNKPILARQAPADEMLRSFVRVKASVFEALYDTQASQLQPR